MFGDHATSNLGWWVTFKIQSWWKPHNFGVAKWTSNWSRPVLSANTSRIMELPFKCGSSVINIKLIYDFVRAPGSSILLGCQSRAIQYFSLWTNPIVEPYKNSPIAVDFTWHPHQTLHDCMTAPWHPTFSACCPLSRGSCCCTELANWLVRIRAKISQCPIKKYTEHLGHPRFWISHGRSSEK